MPAGKTYVKIASQILGSASGTVTFSNLPQNFTDLILVCSVLGNTGGTTDYNVKLNFNSDTGSNYSRTQLTGTGSAPTSGRASNEAYGVVQVNGYLSTTIPTVVTVHLNNYSNGTTYKSYIVRSGPSSTSVEGLVGLWRNTAAINTIGIATLGGQFKSGSTFTIYGIEAAKTPKADGGDIIVSDGSYWYHAFKYSGTFVPKTALTCDYLVVAGGGGGGYNAGAGGGAGGLRSTVTATGGGGSLESALSLTASTGYTVTIGAGGMASFTGSTQGSNSTFSTITSTGGGRGGDDQGAGGSGGSGGGSATGGAGSGTSGQGYGGNNGGGSGASRYGGGGGGAGAAASSSAGAAGVSIPAFSVAGTGISNYYAGGGGGGYHVGTGGAGGSGGGGAGGTGNYPTSGNTGTAGTTNTGGGGGGGAGGGYAGANGGSGIVIVRYAV